MRPSRLELVDSLRGFALMGLFLVHSVENFELYWADPRPSAAFDWAMALFSGKAYALFALCFGLSFFIIMDRARRKGVDFTARFAWRLSILFAFGLAHSMIYRGDILQILAPAGLLLLFADRIRNPRWLLAIAAIFLLQPELLVRSAAALEGASWALRQPSFWTDSTMATLTGGSFLDVLRVNAVDARLFTWGFSIETGRVSQIVGLFLVGLWLGRIGFFARPQDFAGRRRVAMAVALLISAVLALAGPAVLDTVEAAAGESMARVPAETLLSSWSALAVMAFQMLLFVELYQTVGRTLLRRLAPAGRMTLTLYVGQSLAFVPVYYGFGLAWHQTIAPAQALALGGASFAAQLVLAHWWFRHFHYGPLEWLWRAATFVTTDIPFRRREAPALQAAG